MAHFTRWMRLVLALALLAGALAFAPAIQAQVTPPVRTPTASPNQKYFHENGHNIEEPFASVYEALGGARVLGLPITEKFTLPSGQLVQYFERFRLDYNINATPQVTLAPLGADLAKKGEAPLSVRERDPACLYFPETGHQTCLAFAAYYKNNNLGPILGPAVGRMTLEGGRMVQYFRNGRLDFFPEQPAANRVQIAALGLVHFDFMGLDRKYLDPAPSLLSVPAPIISLRARAQVGAGFVAAGNAQTITVRVVDQLGRPVAEAQVETMLKLPNNSLVKYLMPLTDANGLTTLTVPVPANLRNGSMVHVQANVVRGPHSATTVTSFIIWGWGR